MMSYAQRVARRGGSMPSASRREAAERGEPLDAEALAKLRELLKDAETCGRLNNFEQNFLADRQAQLAQYGDDIRLSEKQRGVLRKIEEHVYACG